MHRRTLTAAVLASTVLLAGPVLAQQDPGVNERPSGTIAMSARAAAIGVGYSWGNGVLNYGGHRYSFRVDGVSIADVGFARISSRGRVYHLNKVDDFSGTYAAATGEATLGNGIGGQILRNANGVMIRVDQTTRGARLTGSADGIKLTLIR